jgi:hypothetical protein
MFVLFAQSCLDLGKIPREKVCDRGFLMMLLSQRLVPHESHRVELLYDGILGWLTNRSTFETMQHVAETSASSPASLTPEYRTPSRSAMSSYFSLLEAVRHILRRHGYTNPQLKQFTYAIRREFVRRCSTGLDTLLNPEAAGSASAGMGAPSVALTNAKDALALVADKLIKNPGKVKATIAEGSVVAFYFSG